MQNGLGIHSKEGVFFTHEQYDILITNEREQEAKITYLEQELAQLKRMIFGSKSERFISNDTDQLSLGLDIEEQEPTAPEQEWRSCY